MRSSPQPTRALKGIISPAAADLASTLTPAAALALKAERRAKREARREKQRAVNLTRAKQMRTARLTYEKAQPPLLTSTKAPGTQHPLCTLHSAPSTVQLHLGCSGWYYWHWKFDFYKDLPSKAWFPHYAATFDTVELNAPFYAWPTTKTVETWIGQAAANPRFRYTVKASELITHIKRFVGTKTLVRDFSHIADLLGPADEGGRFGSFLWQLPPSHTYTPARLKAIATQLEPLSRKHTNVVEFRHKSWWNEAVYKTFRNANLTFCSSSGPRMPDELVETNTTLYLRLHGLKQWYRHDYTEAELQPWITRIRATNATTLYTYFNNDRDGNAIRNAKTFASLLHPRSS